MSRNRAAIGTFLFCAGMGLVAMCILSACDKQHDDDQSRIEKTIEELETHAPQSRALGTLRKSTPTSLQNPTITFARLVEQKETVTLLLEWVESTPSAMAVGIRCGDSDSWKLYPIGEANTQANLEEAERGFVLFNAAVSWDPDSDLWFAIAADVRAGQCTAALFKDGQVVSNIEAIKYISGPTISAGRKQD
jgi:hypothetical protein